MAVDNPGGKLAWRTEANDGEVQSGEGAKLGDGLEVLAEIIDFRDGKIRVRHAQAGSALPDVEQAVFVAIREGTQQHGTHHAENGSIGAYAQGQRESDGEPQRAYAPKRAHSNFQITKE